MKKSLLLCVLMLPLAIFADIKIVCSPYLQSLGEESVDIVWTTDKASISWVEIIPDNGKSFYNAPHTKYFAQKFGRKTIGKQHVVHISGLKKIRPIVTVFFHRKSLIKMNIAFCMELLPQPMYTEKNH
jgi:hypothetical protein